MGLRERVQGIDVVGIFPQRLAQGSQWHLPSAPHAGDRAQARHELGPGPARTRLRTPRRPPFRGPASARACPSFFWASVRFGSRRSADLKLATASSNRPCIDRTAPRSSCKTPKSGRSDKRPSHDLLRLLEARLHHERAPEEPQMVDRLGILFELAAANRFRLLGLAVPNRRERCGNPCVARYFRYLSNHARTRSR